MTFTRLALLISDLIIFGFTILCTIFLLIVILPLYKFSKERTALYILFSKVFLDFFEG